MAASAENGERACFPPPAGLTGWWPGDGHRGNFNDTPGSESDQEFYLNGLVDEVQVFVGRALPRGLIRAIHKAGNSGECKDF